MSLDQLLQVIRRYPVIDNHAHNLLVAEEIDKDDFLSITTEASGNALKDTKTSLSHIKAARQLKELYECDEDATWEDIMKKRDEWNKERPNELIRRCLEGTYSLLLDDGVGGILAQDRLHPYDWHDQFTTEPSKRIVRIETVAEECCAALVSALKLEDFIAAPEFEAARRRSYSSWFKSFEQLFKTKLDIALEDPVVVGFKSVVCYRTGLDVELVPFDNETFSILETDFGAHLEDCIVNQETSYRIECKSINDYLVRTLLDQVRASGTAKPLQLHTGLGDNDINLLKSNPAHLQPLITHYPDVPIVLLHTSYPYTREAGYLAMAYENVYLDIGEAFPMLNREGQVSVLRHCLDLIPYQKILWSTDGHFFPETYWLANKQFREVLEELLPEFISKGDLSYSQAIDLVKSIVFSNSNKLYSLGYDENTVTFYDMPKNDDVQPKANKNAQIISNTKTLDLFTRTKPVKYVYVQYMDYMATLRTRILPISAFEKMAHTGSRIGISRGNTGTLQDDSITPAANPVGQIYLRPDLDSLMRTHRAHPINAAHVMTFWENEEGEPVEICPRYGLLAQLKELETRDISLLVGFEIEVTFLYIKDPDNSSNILNRPLTSNHNWGSLSTEDLEKAVPMLAEMAESLAQVGIHVEQFHSESGNGQYEFVLPPFPPLKAVDVLVRARSIIQEIAHTYGLRATYHPMPLLGIGSAAHAHISLNPLHSTSPKISEEVEMSFWGGVTKHLDAICAFTLPETVSYKRVADNSWTGGTWITWGEQNREAPLRRVKNGGRWEIRCLDGMANMFLALKAVVAAGILGLDNGKGMDGIEQCERNPSTFSEDERIERGMRPMPRTILQSLAALTKDEELVRKLGEASVKDYVDMKEVEYKKLAAMSDEVSRKWLIERY